MNVREYLQINEAYCEVRLADTVSIVETVDLITQAIAFCREQKLPKLLVDVSRLTHLPSPTTVERFLMVEDWAREAKGVVAVAVVAPEGLIHPEKFGVKVAADLGMTANIFAAEREALKWLLAGNE